MQGLAKRNASQMRSGSAGDPRSIQGYYFPNQQRKISFDDNVREVVDMYAQEQNEVDNSFYVPKTLSTNISILMNSRPNLHNRPKSKKQKTRKNPMEVFLPQSQPKRRDDIELKDSYYARVLKNAREHNTREKASSRLQSTREDLLAFRKKTFGIMREEISLFSNPKPHFDKGRKSTTYLEEENYNFDFNKVVPSRISMNDFLEKIKPDVVPQIEPNIHNRSFYIAQQTQLPLPQKKLDLDPLNKSSQLFLSRTSKNARPQSSSKKPEEVSNNVDRTWRDLGFEISKEKFADDSLTLDQRCADKLKYIQEEEHFEQPGRAKSRHEKRSENFIKEAEKLRQEIYNDIQLLETSNLSSALKYQDHQKRHRSLTPYSGKLKL